VPLLFFLLIVVLIATVGFWKTLGAIVGAVAMIFVLIFLVAAIAVTAGIFAASRWRRD
jgi:hypothetical protein